MAINLTELENQVHNLTKNLDQENFIYDLLLLYGAPKATITRLKKGSQIEKKINQIVVKKKLFFEVPRSKDLLGRIDEMRKESVVLRHDPRFIVVTDYTRLLAVDVKTGDTLDTQLKNLFKHYEFFLPWAGREKYQVHQENPADIRAAEKMAKIYDEIIANNKELAEENPHALNVFLTRLLFCYFAEDTGIFPGENQFTRILTEHTREDGEDVADYLQKVFDSLDVKNKSQLEHHLQAFPYVNGTLFSQKFPIPKISAKTRRLMLECGDLDWQNINPDIFGSMFQAVSVAEVRSGLGQHYTSVPNIMKVVEPLFLDELREEFSRSYDDQKKLLALHIRIANIRIFDPACGSGNFLIIAFKQLRLLEIDILQRLRKLNPRKDSRVLTSLISLENFYGIEIDDFACEIAILSMWLAEHQMNGKFKEVLGETLSTLPLHKSGNIVCGNALRLDWDTICPKRGASGSMYEIYILGNPPYSGPRRSDPLQQSRREDRDIVFKGLNNYRNLDYIACWFYKATKYIEGIITCRYAFVSTNSICQGQQVSLLWDKILNDKIEIVFAYTSFKWTNNARRNAGVTCVIIGIANKSGGHKYLYTDNHKTIVDRISAYLTAKENVIRVSPQKRCISKLPNISFGSMPNDNEHLIFKRIQYDEFIRNNKHLTQLFRKLLGSEEFIKGTFRYCLWLTNDNDLTLAKDNQELRLRIDQVRSLRLKSSRPATRKLANKPHLFGEVRHIDITSLIVPSTSSEHREYIPIGFLDKNTIISNSALAVYDPPVWLFGVISSRMHMTWMRTVSGRLKTDYRYSADLCYNTFPFPDISDTQKKKIELCVNAVLRVRGKYPEKTFAQLYDREKMPDDLRQAHRELDLCIEQCYQVKPFKDDEERIALLFEMYQKMTQDKQEPPKRQKKQ